MFDWTLTAKITVQDGSYSDVYGLSPEVSWSNSNQVGDVSVDYGIEADLRVTKDIAQIASLPKSIWGKLSSQLGAWGVSASADLQDYSQADVEVGVENSEEGLSCKEKE